MVGLADIPCVGKIVERVSEYTVAAVFRGLHYMFCYKALVDQLNSETEKLNIEKDSMSRKVMEEKANGKDIVGHVLKWQNDVEEIQESAEEVSPSCWCIPRLPIPADPVSRFYIGRNAAKKAEKVVELTGTGNGYLTGEIAHHPEFKYMPNSHTTFKEFESRKDVYEELWDLLVNKDSLLICGIYGMAGVGKTRMMEKFWEDAMKKNIFKKVVRVNVGNENLKEVDLQEKIADRLNCNLNSQDVENRAFQLGNSLRNIEGKILLILDDVWTDIHLDKIIGIPFGDGSSSSKGSKILLTSRKKDVCLDNKCKHVIQIKTLSPDEALDLFKKVVAPDPDSIHSLPDESLVKQVCDKCGQLPLLIDAVGKALKGKPKISWDDALVQLEKGEFEEIPDVKPEVYAGIKLSIDLLQKRDAKLCLFLCSMFPEDANIDMKMLIQLATGSGLIESRVLVMVHHLKISSLLLRSEMNNDETKVHDIIRDVARSVASTDPEYAFLHVKCNSKFPSNASDCTTRKFLRLDAETDDVHFDEDLVCPEMHTLWLQSNNHPQQFSGGFFRMFDKLICLMLQKVNISVEKFSLHDLGYLETLSLLDCDMTKTDGSLFPKKLKTLCICECKLPIPLDVANLKCLQKLEIQVNHWRQPKLVMVSNVISSLSSLEELHIPNGFIYDHGYHLEPMVMEISKLNRLKSLHFKFYEDDTFQGTDKDIFSNIDKYNLFVGTRVIEPFMTGGPWRVPLTRRSIEFRGNHWKSWEGLMARAEEVRLENSDVEVSSICNVHTRAFQDLESLYIDNCDNMGHVASKSHDEIQYSLQSPACFSKLNILEIYNCSKLKYLFCNNIAKSLVQLQELTVEWCESMEAIIMNEGDTSDGEIINFSKLKSLRISETPRLTSFYVEKKNTNLGSSLSMDPPAQYQSLFDGMVAFPSLEYIQVDGCSRLRSMFPLSVARHLTHLKGMEVTYCKEMREIIEAGEQVITDDGIVLFPQLTVLKLFSLQSLRSFWCYQSGRYSTCKVPLRLPQLSSILLAHMPELQFFFHGPYFEFHMPALKEVEVSNCPLSTLFTLSMLRKSQLETLTVTSCRYLVNIVEDLRGDETSGINGKSITSCQLPKITLESLPNLKSFSCTASYNVFNMPKLKVFRLIECPRIEYFSSSEINTSGVSVTSDWVSEAGVQDLNDFIRQYHKRGSYLSEHAGESSYSSQDLGTQSEN